MELNELQRHIRFLAELPKTEAPVVSCYLGTRRVAIFACAGEEPLLRTLRFALPEDPVLNASRESSHRQPVEEVQHADA